MLNRVFLNGLYFHRAHFEAAKRVCNFVSMERLELRKRRKRENKINFMFLEIILMWLIIQLWLFFDQSIWFSKAKKIQFKFHISLQIYFEMGRQIKRCTQCKHTILNFNCLLFNLYFLVYWWFCFVTKNSFLMVKFA